MYLNLDKSDVIHHILKRAASHEQKNHGQEIGTPDSAEDRSSADIQGADGDAALTDAGLFDGLRTGMVQGESAHGLSEDYPYVWSL